MSKEEDALMHNLAKSLESHLRVMGTKIKDVACKDEKIRITLLCGETIVIKMGHGLISDNIKNREFSAQAMATVSHFVEKHILSHDNVGCKPVPNKIAEGTLCQQGPTFLMR